MSYQAKMRLVFAAVITAGVAAMVLIFATLAHAQSFVPENRIKPGTIAGIYINVVGQGIVLAQIDPSSPVSINSATNPPTISFNPPASTPTPRIPFQTMVIHLQAAQSMFTLNPSITYPDALQVWVGGLAMSPTEDYSLAGSTISFNVSPQIGDVVRITYQ